MIRLRGNDSAEILVVLGTACQHFHDDQVLSGRHGDGKICDLLDLRALDRLLLETGEAERKIELHSGYSMPQWEDQRFFGDAFKPAA